MNTDINEIIKSEADRILFTNGLHNLLKVYGKVFITGSYTTNLMTWRDLDICLVNDRVDLNMFFEVGKNLEALLKPKKMHWRNELIDKKDFNLPTGLYWGIYFTDEGKNEWKIDVWNMSNDEYVRTSEYQNELIKELNDVNRKTIIRIKSQCCENKKYRRDFFSTDIYEAVIKSNIDSYEKFAVYMKNKGIEIS